MRTRRKVCAHVLCGGSDLHIVRVETGLILVLRFGSKYGLIGYRFEWEGFEMTSIITPGAWLLVRDEDGDPRGVTEVIVLTHLECGFCDKQLNPGDIMGRFNDGEYITIFCAEHITPPAPGTLTAFVSEDEAWSDFWKDLS